ncbi:MAG: hypothetical protein LN590_05360 [Rickettsia endosymbiont of Glossina mortisans submortisans]|nr:hypothetical protein [Rickettsia endosymbiont of Glossina mortisans submortisans]
MSKLRIFLASINANELIAELEKDPATLNINDEVLPNHLEDLLKTLKGDDTVKTLKMEDFLENSESLKYFVEFFTDPECLITDIVFRGNILSDNSSVNLFTQAFSKNNTIKEITFSNSNLEDIALSAILENLSKENIETLSFLKTKIKLESEKVRNDFINFLTKSNIKNFSLSRTDITQESKIELFKAIPKMNLNTLDLAGFNLNHSDIDIFCEVIKHSKINALAFSLGREISNESKVKLLTSIENNKAVLSCLVTGPNDMSPQEKQEKKAWTSQINERTDKNQSILEEVAQVLKDWSETPNDLHNGTIHSYLKLYQKLNKDSIIEELEKLKVTDANFILENADKYINEHFFEMVGIAKEVYADGLFVPTDITSYIASCIGDLSNIINKSSDIES